MSEQRVNFVKQKFTEYYQQTAEQRFIPSSLEKREFGFMLFKNNVMIRHMKFTSMKNLQNFLLEISPSDVYYSSAYYEKPSQPMEKKGWLGADLIFDIDFDHLSIPCEMDHGYWLCEGCDNALTALRAKCPHCGQNKFRKETWLCESCLEVARNETLKLLDFLTSDFGFNPMEIEISFSGHRGYHVHVKNEEVSQFNQSDRREIVDYITGTGLRSESHGLMMTTIGLEGPNLTDPGWRGRIARGVYGYLTTSTSQQLPKIKAASKIQSHRDLLLVEKWDNRWPWDAIKNVGLETWKQIIKQVIQEQASDIDTVVTTDTRRLIRLPLSLHSKTGLIAKKIQFGTLEKFDPLTEAVAFKNGEMKIFVNESHRFRIGDRQFRPFKKETVRLPMAAAVFLLCKKAAVLVK
jgi:DNA primase small subunit